MRCSASGGAASTLAALCVVLLALSPSPSYASPAIDPKAAPIACACPLNWAPVCGSDGITYGNDCPIVKCGNGSVKVVSQGPCPEKVPATGTATTDPIKPAPVNPSTTAKPTPVPTQKPAAQRPLCRCNRMYAPVCATNGQFSRTFPSECVMRCSPGTWTVVRQGPCDDTPKPRGSTPGSTRRSAAPLQKPGCACPYIFMPVCATNGIITRTFSNDCLATKCAVGDWQVVSQGACVAAAAGKKHHDGLHDDRPRRWSGSVGMGVGGGFGGAGMGVGGGMLGGQRPQGTSAPCVCGRIYLPVCAKDLNSGRTRTFDNPCQVERCTNNSYQILYMGACKDTGSTDVTAAPVTRPAVTRPAVTRPTVTSPGASKPPVACACPAIYAPVCGTDGVTYDNDCLLTRCRQPGGATVAYEGPCRTSRTSGAPAASGLPRKLLGEAARVPVGPGAFPGADRVDIGDDVGYDVGDELEDGYGDMDIPADGAPLAGYPAMPLPNVPVVTQAGVYNIDAMPQAVAAARPQWMQQVVAAAHAQGFQQQLAPQGVELEQPVPQGGEVEEQGPQEGYEEQGPQEGYEEQGPQEGYEEQAP